MKFTLTTDAAAHSISVIDKHSIPSGIGYIETFTLRWENLNAYGLYIDPNMLIPNRYNTPEIMHLLEPWLLNIIEQGLIDTEGDRQSAYLRRIEFLELPSTAIGILKIVVFTQPYKPNTMPQVVSRRYNDTMASNRTYTKVRSILAEHFQINPDQLGSPRIKAEHDHHRLMNRLIDASLELSGWEFYQGACKTLAFEVGEVGPSYRLVEAIFTHLINFLVAYRTADNSIGTSARSFMLRDLYAETLNEATYDMIIQVSAARARNFRFLPSKVASQTIDNLRLQAKNFLNEPARMFPPDAIAQLEIHLQKFAQFTPQKPETTIISSMDGFILITANYQTESLTRGLDVFLETNAIRPDELPQFRINPIASAAQINIHLLNCPASLTTRLIAFIEDYLRYDTNSKSLCNHQWKRLLDHIIGPIGSLAPNLACNLCGATATYAGDPQTYLTHYRLIEIMVPASQS